MSNRFISFTHANTNRAVMVSTDQVFAVQFSDAHKCTHVISHGGAIIPVIEAPEVVTARLEQAQVFVKEVKKKSTERKRKHE